MKKILKHAIIAGSLLMLLGCYQGRPSKDEPIHINPNMDHQQKYRPQAESNFFEDGATMRPVVEGTVARGELKEDTEFYYGKDEKGDFITGFPDKIMFGRELVERGHERFNIYCSPCHGRTGTGRGIIVERGLVPPPSFHTDSIKAFPNGRIFDVITNGIRNMQPYKYQIPEEDRWAIIAFFRALQRSHDATIEDVPQSQRGNL